RDDVIDPSRGIFNTLDAGLASRYFGSGVSFFRALGRNNTYHPVAGRYVLARSLSLGAIRPFGFSERAGSAELAVPFAERFFAGGSASHRGFPENQAGARDLTTGFPLGGNALLFHNTEFRFPLLGDNIGGVFFHDAGNVYSTPGDISFRVKQRDVTDFNYMVHAAGFGLRYRTPIGPLRVDLAYTVNPPRFVGFEGDFDELLACSRPGAVRPCPTSRQRLSGFNFFISIGQTF
ncbi:MAG: hypothetical protein FJW37_14280, partial [Acidobacteria bacterium]|nr:hypothetical protein [Acidobacteriota bacterium]